MEEENQGQPANQDSSKNSYEKEVSNSAVYITLSVNCWAYSVTEKSVQSLMLSIQHSHCQRLPLQLTPCIQP